MKVVLASSSPRRIELIRQLFSNVIIAPADIDEDSIPIGPDYPLPVALAKLKKVASKERVEIIIAADTVVYLDGTYHQKPVDIEDARKILLTLKGHTHIVKTAVAILKNNEIITFIEESFVTFKNFTDSELEKYLATGEYRDKSGAYSIQGDARNFLGATYRGDYDNIVGLPVAKIKKVLDL